MQQKKNLQMMPTNSEPVYIDVITASIADLRIKGHPFGAWAFGPALTLQIPSHFGRYFRSALLVPLKQSVLTLQRF